MARIPHAGRQLRREIGDLAETFPHDEPDGLGVHRELAVRTEPDGALSKALQVVGKVDDRVDATYINDTGDTVVRFVTNRHADGLGGFNLAGALAIFTETPMEEPHGGEQSEEPPKRKPRAGKKEEVSE